LGAIFAKMTTAGPSLQSLLVRKTLPAHGTASAPATASVVVQDTATTPSVVTVPVKY
jgi:hypothetical protein